MSGSFSRFLDAREIRRRSYHTAIISDLPLADEISVDPRNDAAEFQIKNCLSFVALNGFCKPTRADFTASL
jgi:hypothetical protein